MARNTAPRQRSTDAAYFMFPRMPLIPYTKRYGTLSLDDRTITLRRKDRVVFSGPAHEFHSFAPCFDGFGFHLWQGRKLHVLAVPTRTTAGSTKTELDAGARAAEHVAELASYATWTEDWGAALRPVIAKSSPVGVKVGSPMSGGRMVLLVTLAAFAIVAAVAIAAVLNR